MKNLNKMVSNALTGVAVTMAVGTAAYMMTQKSPAKKRRQMKKTADRAIHAVGEIVDGISSVMH
ncbi:hypothetical protein DW086_13715 [Harryflintia acetispora]|nr:hypothetical protein DW086_13715 [Harryflintia acetispora]